MLEVGMTAFMWLRPNEATPLKCLNKNSLIISHLELEASKPE
jgi:hypothetical protein